MKDVGAHAPPVLVLPGWGAAWMHMSWEGDRMFLPKRFRKGGLSQDVKGLLFYTLQDVHGSHGTPEIVFKLVQSRTTCLTESKTCFTLWVFGLNSSPAGFACGFLQCWAMPAAACLGSIAKWLATACSTCEHPHICRITQAHAHMIDVAEFWARSITIQNKCKHTHPTIEEHLESERVGAVLSAGIHQDMPGFKMMCQQGLWMALIRQIVPAGSLTWA